MRRSCIIVLLAAVAAWCQNLGSLKRVSVPKTDLSPYVADPNLLVVLGKALFWDMQLASDGRVACASCHFHAGADHREVACASCHFHAGADHRVQNQLSNPLGTFVPNYTLTLADFPFHQLANADDNR